MIEGTRHMTLLRMVLMYHYSIIMEICPVNVKLMERWPS